MSGELINSYNEIIELIEQAKNRVNVYFNRELIDLYLGIGEYVSKKDKNILRRKLHEFCELADYCQTLYLEEQDEVKK